MLETDNTTGLVSVSELVHRTFSYRFTDPCLFNSLKDKLQRFYESSKNHKNSEIHFKESQFLIPGNKRASSDFRFRSSFSKPRIDKALEMEISKYGKHTLPSSISMPEHRDVYRSDVDCIIRYSKISGNPKRSYLRSFVVAGIHAARHMNLIRDDGGPKFTALSTVKAVEDISKNTNSGYPFFSSKSSDKCRKDTIRWLDNILDSGTSFRLFKNSLMSNPEIIFNRFQPTLSDDLNTLEFKIRQVWCVPQRIVALEQVFFGNLLDYHKTRQQNRLDPVVTSGLTNKHISVKCVKRLRNMMGPRSTSNRCMYSLDYSKFDSTIPDFAIDIFFSICRTQINLDNKHDKIYDLLRFYTKRSPYIYCGSYGFQQRGISSGSLITSTFDSWWNLTLWYLARASSHYCGDKINSIGYKGTDVLDCLSHSRFHLSEFSVFPSIVVCGDDVLITCSEDIIKSHNLICDYLGMKCTVYKIARKFEDSIFFLGRFWDMYNRPYQTEEYITAHIISRTKWYKKDEVDFDISKDLDVFRILSICCPLYNGRSYINKYLKDYQPLTEFMEDRSKLYYHLLKDWHSESYSLIPKDRLSDWTIY